jgi:hypothetical protein
VTDLPRLIQGLGALRGSGVPRLVAIGWATVDLDRTLADLSGDAALTADEPLLGARAARVAAGPIVVLVLEPTTEGRLAAALARRGEGICALYLATGVAPTGVTEMTAMGVRGRLMPHDRPWGPFVIEVSDP